MSNSYTASQATGAKSTLSSAGAQQLSVPFSPPEKWRPESLLLVTKPHLKPRPNLDQAFRDPIGPRVRDYDQKIWGPHNRYRQV